MKKLFVYMKIYTKECILGPLFKLLEASFDLIVPLVVAAIIDTGIANHDMAYVLKMCGILVLLAVVGLACALVAQFFAAKAAVGFAANLRSALFKRIQSLTFTQQDKVGTSTLITRMTSDINQVQSGTNLALRLLLRSPFVVFGAMIMAFTIDWRCALTFAATIPLLSIVVFGIMLWSIPNVKKVQGKLDGVLSSTRESLTGARILRAFCKEEQEIRQFTERNDALTALQKKVGRVSGMMNPLTYVLINGGVIALLYVGALRVNAGSLSQGQVVALYNYMGQVLVELVKLANLIISITKALACLGRVNTVMEMNPDMVSGETLPETASSEAVRFDNVTLTYAGAGAPSLQNISFTAYKGQTIGIIGGTGAGKTSLVSLIPRFYDATEGEILINGQNVKDYPLQALRQRIGIVPQKAVLFKGSIRENLCWGKRDATEDEMLAALSDAQGLDILNEKPEGLDTEIAQMGSNLSGGQRQRLTIARALIGKPEILILDDSASALDYMTDLHLRQAIKRFSDMTVFIVSQRTAAIRNADLILVLDEGKVCGMGTHEELLKNNEVYQEIYYSQYEKEEQISG